MRILKLSAQHMQGADFSDDLLPVTLYCGDNMTGKTTRINTLHLVLAGYVPNVAKTNPDIFDSFSSGNPLFCGALLDDGQNLQRQWEQSKGKIIYKGVSDEQWKGLPPVLLDADEYFGLSDKERTRFVFQRAKLNNELTVTKLCNSITANLKNMVLKENTEQTQSVIKELCEFIANQGFDSGHISSQEWIHDLAGALREKKLLADQNVRRMEKTVQGLTQVKETSGAPADAEARYNKAQAELEKVNAEVARLMGIGLAIKEELDKTKELAAKAVDETGARKTLAELSKEKERLFKATSGAPPGAKEFADYQMAVVVFNQSDKAYNSSKQEFDRIADQIKEAKKSATCPTCGQSMAKIKKKVVAELEKQLKVSEENVLRLCKSFDATQTERDRLDQKWKEASVKAQQFNDDAAAFRKASQYHAELQTILSANESANAAVKALPELEAKITFARNQYNVAAQLAIQKKEALNLADKDYRLLLAERAFSSSKAKSIMEASKARAESVLLKEACELVLTLQEELVKQAINPIIESCNRLCNGILKHPLVFRDGEIGMLSNNAFVRHKTMSGAERTLCRCAVSLALASESPFKLVVIDELGRLSAANKQRLVENVIQLHEAGEIHQAILVDLEPAAYAHFPKQHPKTFKIINVN
ncbi:MAG: hypothetical protein KGL39_51385 [Patescibacteria group bacterium]|nr:hypothetical protein [Patescibacteria group bacterium]